jgi:3-oxoacyl-[acyl-carrier protein] reductase
MKYALVTGGSRGIGRSISLKLSAMGYPVIVNYRSNQEAAEETKRLIEEAGGVCELLPFNVSDVEAVDKAMEQWSEKHPEDYIAVLVNNAGIREDTLMVFMQNEQWAMC